MKSVVRTLFTLALAVVIASPLLAAEGKKGKKAARRLTIPPSRS